MYLTYNTAELVNDGILHFLQKCGTKYGLRKTFKGNLAYYVDNTNYDDVEFIAHQAPPQVRKFFRESEMKQLRNLLRDSYQNIDQLNEEQALYVFIIAHFYGASLNALFASAHMHHDNVNKQRNQDPQALMQAMGFTNKNFQPFGDLIALNPSMDFGDLKNLEFNNKNAKDMLRLTARKIALIDGKEDD